MKFRANDSPEGRRWPASWLAGRMRGEEKAFLHPSPAAHLSMGVTLSLRERNSTVPTGREKNVPVLIFTENRCL